MLEKWIQAEAAGQKNPACCLFLNLSVLKKERGGSPLTNDIYINHAVSSSEIEMSCICDTELENKYAFQLGTLNECVHFY